MLMNGSSLQPAISSFSVAESTPNWFSLLSLKRTFTLLRYALASTTRSFNCWEDSMVNLWGMRSAWNRSSKQRRSFHTPESTIFSNGTPAFAQMSTSPGEHASTQSARADASSTMKGFAFIA